MASSLRLLSSRCVLAATSFPRTRVVKRYSAIFPVSTRSLFSSSSASISVFEYDAAYEDDLDETEHTNITSTDSKSSPISLNEFISSLPSILHGQKRYELSSPHNRTVMENLRGTDSDPVTQLFSRLYLSQNEIRGTAILDPSVKYTRSLVATDDATFSLLLLCWNPDTESPIHDHPCDGCWVRVCNGVVKETRYEVDETKDCLVVSSEEIFDSKSIGYRTLLLIDVMFPILLFV
ncbi:hypothetical protein HJC23_007680 [Cyclotella cryptica]|uniref:Cysteine dioxygenase n=1 Tax=Cyclotella cryptica TaxID=29204 RepID=A0ABD3PT32_9STRA